MNDEPRLVWELENELGEGPVWVERDRALWFTDIKRLRIYRYDPATGDQQGWHAPEQVGFVFPAEKGDFIVGLQSGLHRFEPCSHSAGHRNGRPTRGESASITPVARRHGSAEWTSVPENRWGACWAESYAACDALSGPHNGWRSPARSRAQRGPRREQRPS